MFTTNDCKLEKTKKIKSSSLWQQFTDRWNFTALPQLKDIERLELELTLRDQLETNFQLMIKCPKLKKLVINYAELTESFFKDIHSSIPRLEFLTIVTDQKMSDQFFTSLSSMKYLQKVLYCHPLKKRGYYYNNSFKKCGGFNIKSINSNCCKVDHC